LAQRYRNTNNVAVGFFGDGATGTGNFHEGINMAAVLRVPAIFVCENNLYAQFTPARDAVPIDDIAIRAQGYGIPGEIVDGQDVIAVHQAVQKAIARARAGEGPSLIECKTYRYGEHCQGMDADRTEEEMAAWKARDPIKLMASRLIDQGVANQPHLEMLDEAIMAELESAINYAETADDPQPGDALAHIFANTGDRQ
jgi:TPP-dependent pyruvate/acetoin dehydrogenase alpha subunit